ncbi:V-type ATPase subunit [Streptomyces sp. 142MFCol3.1]|uniref:V-type ATPase subunit n=1 Tax=Streptomyces sp. 142MFCol3.1 TaxID=1172179 RepID=UPI0004903952|nr:V-type ATPase subunit [Streptomyces sp. 142MFCol3.1]
MSAGWVAGSVRAKALAGRYPGVRGAREIAACVTLDDALRHLAATPYSRYTRASVGLAEAQRAVTATLLWHLRVLAGWLPRGGARLLVPLAAGFEIANVTARLLAQDGRGQGAPEPYRLGALETAWRSLEHAGTPVELRAALATSPWGDPGGDTPWALVSGMRMAAARRTAVAVPHARPWAEGRAALLIARELFVHQRTLPTPLRRDAARLLGSRAPSAATYQEFREGLPETARWVVADVAEPGGLWRAEAGWWRRLDKDGAVMLRDARLGPRVVVGAVATLSVDAWRVRAALESAARGGRPEEAFDALG